MSEASSYNDRVVRQFAIMTLVWGVVGMLVGVITRTTGVRIALRRALSGQAGSTWGVVGVGNRSSRSLRQTRTIRTRRASGR